MGISASGGGGPLDYSACEGRLTLTSGTPVTTSDVTAATTLYFTPYTGNRIGLNNGSAWQVHTFTELSIAIPATTDTNYDVFVYDNSGTPTLELLAWSDATTRATAIAFNGGVYVKSGDATRRYLGTIRTTGVSGQCEDSLTSRFVWNYYNRILRLLRVKDTTSHAYTTDAWRYWNNDSGNQLNYVCGVIEDEIETFLHARHTTAAGGQAAVAVGDDGLSTLADGGLTIFCDTASLSGPWSLSYAGFPELGYHYLALMERSYAANNTYTLTQLCVTMKG